jgi:acyl carrier protein
MIGLFASVIYPPKPRKHGGVMTVDATLNLEQNKRRQRLIALVAEILEIDDPASIRLTDRLREDLGMDSLGSLELLSTISEELKLDLEMEEAMGISTVEEAFTFIERNYAEQCTHEHANC